jgi:hypothetical protein
MKKLMAVITLVAFAMISTPTTASASHQQVLIKDRRSSKRSFVNIVDFQV